ncbi:hypothetical protein IGI04_019638, partial [Brassica rapa subsp. trilocularis]
SKMKTTRGKDKAKNTKEALKPVDDIKVRKRKARLRRLACGRRRPRRIQTNPKELSVPYLSS